MSACTSIGEWAIGLRLTSFILLKIIGRKIRNHVFEIHGVNVINIFVQLPMEMNGPK